MLKSDLIRNIAGLTGGIVHVPETCKEAGQAQGCGVTIYHFVESIDEVCSTPDKLLSPPFKTSGAFLNPTNTSS